MRTIILAQSTLLSDQEAIEIGHAYLDSLPTEIKVINHLIAPVAHHLAAL
jgi:hypothetical protein